jgi:hypothetical protein
MGRHTRTFTPRSRTTRPLGVPLTPNQSPTSPLSPPSWKDTAWYIDAPLASRLHQKSAIGRTDSDGGVFITNEEVLFCHWHRHVPLPSATWFQEALDSDPDLVARSVAFDVARSGGELVVPVVNLPEKRGFAYSEMTWALRWNREQNFTKDDPIAHVRWAWTTDDVDWEEMETWTAEVTQQGLLAELFVVDEELDVTMYRLSYADIRGNQRTWDSLTDEDIKSLNDAWAMRIERGDGWYIPGSTLWAWSSLGVEHLSGRHLRSEEGRWLESRITDSEVPEDLRLYDDLMSRGVVLRPGFKYGSKWRIYDAAIGEAHAPWLLVPSNQAPSHWNGACLSVRLAEGVHKAWICGFHDVADWRYLQVKRWLPGR